MVHAVLSKVHSGVQDHRELSQEIVPAAGHNQKVWPMDFDI